MQTPALSPADVRALSERADLPAAIRAASHLGAALATGWLVLHVRAGGAWPWLLPLLFAQGFFIAFLFMALHECAHKTAFRSKAANLVVGHLAGLTIALPYEYYFIFHWAHHRHTQDPARDPELLIGAVPTSDARLAIAFTGMIQLASRVALLLRHAIAGEVTAPWVRAGKRRLVIREARAYAAVYLAAAAGSAYAHSDALLWVWVIPLALGQLLLRPYLYSEHTGCSQTRSAFENTRTTRASPVLRWFSWNMPYHVEHHAYPTVPFHALPRLNAAVDHRILHRGRSYPAVTRAAWSWLRRERSRTPGA